MDTTPIFPLPTTTNLVNGVVIPGNCGMMLRDYLAGQALVGLMVSNAVANMSTTGQVAAPSTNALVIDFSSQTPAAPPFSDAYAVADSILSNR